MQQRKTAAFTYNLIRTKRRGLSLSVNADGRILVYAPYRMPVGAMDSFVESHGDWITERLRLAEQLRAARPSYTEAERAEGKKRAARILEEKCRLFAEQMGVTYGKISVREQKTRWGSCSFKGNLNFNWKLAQMPEEIQDYLVVHELAHRLEMNHSPAFWAVVEGILPDYRNRRRWLKENGKNY